MGSKFTRARLLSKLFQRRGLLLLFGLALAANSALFAPSSAQAATVYARDYGFNAADATAALQNAINSGADTVVVSNMGTNWIVRPIILRSNLKIVFEPGVVVEAMRGQYHGTNDSLFTADHKTNITLEGNGAVLKMHREDYTNPALYSYSQWRHVFYFLSCSNVTLKDMTMRDSGGDGLFIGSFGGQAPCTNFRVTNVNCDNNYRQGISVTNANGVLIENSVMQNTWGQEPQAGIDFEPDDASMQLVNCVVTNCRFINNNAAGVLIYPQMMNSNSPNLSITISKCYFTSKTGWGIQFMPLYANGVGGYVRFEDCVLEDIQGPGIFMMSKAAYRAQLQLVRCTFNRVAKASVNGFPANPFVFSNQFAGQTPQFGGFQFTDCALYDSGNRPFLYAYGGGLANIKGNLYITNPYPAGLQANYGVNAQDIALTVTPGAPVATATTAPGTATATRTSTPVFTATRTATRTATSTPVPATATPTPVQVVNGAVYAKDFGYNATDATAALQNAINSGAGTVIVSNMGSPWIVRPIFLRSNLKIIFENGVVVQAMRGQFKGTNDSLFTADHKSNITLEGYGAVLKMFREDYTNATLYSYSQWRHVFYFLSCDRVTLKGLTMRDSGGDGLFVGSFGGQPACTNFYVKDVVCDNNYRQGVSVTNAENFLIEDSVMKNTWGQEPQAGIDFEPDDASMRLVNCVVDNCRFENNNAAGVLIYPQQMNSSTPAMSITIKNSYITSKTGWGIQLMPLWQDGVGGLVRFENCVIENVQGPGVFMMAKAAYRAQYEFVNCTWNRVARASVNGFPANPFVMSGQFPDRTPEFGGLRFTDSVVYDDVPRYWWTTLVAAGSKGLANVKGNITVINPNAIGSQTNYGAGAHDISLAIATSLPGQATFTATRTATPVFTATPTATATATATRTATPTPTPQPPAGGLGTVYAKDFGWNATDATDALQKAIQSGAKTVVVSKMASDWIVRPIRLASNQEIIFEAGVVVSAKAGEFRGLNDSLFIADRVSNVTVRGHGAILRMRKADYLSAAYPASKWRHVFYIMSSSNLTLLDLTARDSGGDGIFIGSFPGQAASSNITLRNVVCDNNGRTGVTVNNADNLVIDGCRMANTSGIDWQAGMNFEPDAASQRITRCLVSNTRFENNARAGIQVSAQYLNGTSEAVSLSFLNCTVTSANGWGVQLQPVPASGANGYVEFQDCLIQDVRGPGLYANSKAAYRLPVYFRNCLWRRVAKAAVGTLPAVPLYLTGDASATTPEYGGLVFENCEVDDNPNSRAFLRAAEPAASRGCANLKGNLILWNSAGTRVELGAKAHDIRLNVSNALNPASGRVLAMDASGLAVEGMPQVTVEEHQVVAYPNPARGQASFLFAVSEPQTVSLKLYNPSGELILSVAHPARAGQNILPCDVSRLASGIYVYTLQTSAGMKRGKLAVVK